MSQRKPRRTPRTPWRDIDGHAVIVQTPASEVHELNPTATLLWSLADGTRGLDEIARAVSERFEVAPPDARDDAIRFYEGLEARGLLSWEAESSPT